MFQKQSFLIICFIKNVIFLPKNCFTSKNQIFHKEKHMFYHNTHPGKSMALFKKHIFHFSCSQKPQKIDDEGFEPTASPQLRERSTN